MEDSMKNIVEILKELGIEIPDGKESDLTKEVAENYKTVAEFDKKVAKLQKDVDDITARAETAEETLKGFDGKDFDAIENSRKEWETKYNELVQAQADAEDKAAYDSAVEAAIKAAKGRDAVSIKAHLDENTLRASKNRDTDIAAAVKAISEAEATKFLFETDPETKRARFTSPQGRTNGASGKAWTKADIMAIKDRTERWRVMEENMDLFTGGNTAAEAE
jgi:hypothetical protein